MMRIKLKDNSNLKNRMCKTITINREYGCKYCGDPAAMYFCENCYEQFEAERYDDETEDDRE